MIAASQEARCCCRGEIRVHSPPPRASAWVTMCTSILPDCWTTAAPMPSSKIRAHRDRRDVPITSWVAFISRAKSSSAVGTSSPTTVCTVAPRLAANSRTLPICGAETPDKPVTTDDVHHHQFGARLRRDARCPAHQSLRFGATGDGHDDTLACLPGGGDLLLGAVLLQRRVDLVGQPQQRKLTQRGQVARGGSSWTAPRRSAPARRRCRERVCAAALPA